ncbi:hypothetical protein [Mariprofundus ferrooxydans]|uniref:hypothetical protein n=1 Tax=Mariprofundus ferrooxydans TaxID=314344 RepID=UPI00142FE9CC|nr:hypothetical protein [Mariprofundus ferrooxydans]
MLFDLYDENALLLNTNFKSKADADNTFAYRGELVLVEGEIGDAKGRKKPPVSVMRNAVLLSVDDKLTLVSGCLDELDQLTEFVAKYKGDFAAEMKALFFVVNITQPMQVVLEGVTFALIPLTEGIAWNELLDVLHLEKSDLKGQSSAEKVVTAYKEFASFKAKGDVVTMEEAAGFTADIKREGYGAI